MRYDEAFSIGSVIEGIIKCSWAEVFDENDKKIFSMQNRNFSPTLCVPEKRYDKTDILADTKSETYALNLAWTNKRVFEAVVTADTYRYDYKVPVSLTSNAAVLVAEIVTLRNKKYNEKIETLNEQLNEGYAWLIENKQLAQSEIDKMQKLVDGNTIQPYEKERYRQEIEKYQKYIQRLDEVEAEKYGRVLEDLRRYQSFVDENNTLIDGLEAGKIFYIKPKAFEWYPLNTNNVVKSYEEAKRKYEQAKTIMAVSAASIIL